MLDHTSVIVRVSQVRQVCDDVSARVKLMDVNGIG